MNLFFCLVVLVGVGILTIGGRPNDVLGYLLQGTTQGVQLAIRLIAIYSLWMGIMQIAKGTKLDCAMAKVCKPVLGRLFKGENDRTLSLISLNLTANFLGLGGAATPLGIAAMESMSDNSEVATPNMILFFVMNVTAVQMVPGTVMALRQEAGSAHAGDILMPTFLATGITMALGLLLSFCCARWAKKHPPKIKKKKKAHAILNYI